MNPLFTLLFITSLVALGVGQLRPGWVLPWNETKTKGKAGLIYGVAAAILLILKLMAPVPLPVFPEEVKPKDIKAPPKQEFNVLFNPGLE